MKGRREGQGSTVSKCEGFKVRGSTRAVFWNFGMWRSGSRKRDKSRHNQTSVNEGAASFLRKPVFAHNLVR